MKIVEYKVVGEEKLNELNNIVSKHVANGWQPLGGAQVLSTSGGNMFFYQTLVVYSK